MKLATLYTIYRFLMLNYVEAYEEYIILPENSEYCTSYPTFRRFYLSRQMSFTSGVYNDSWNHLIYVCKVKVHPNGRLLHYTYPQGHTSFWFHRLKVDIEFASCLDTLMVGFLPEEFTQPGLPPENVSLTCRDTFPKIFESRHRVVSLEWHTTTGSTEVVSSKLDVQMSAYMRFEGEFGIQDKIQRCESGSGFWCGNQTAVCVYGLMRCDQADGCFDGGTDELGCPPPRNYTTDPDPRQRNSWPVFLPWTALCLIPIVLIFVLGLICTPRKASLDDLDTGDEEDYKADRASSPSSSSATSSECAASIKSTQSAIYPSPGSIVVLTQPVSRCCSNPILSIGDQTDTDLCHDCPDHHPRLVNRPSLKQSSATNNGGPVLPSKSSLSHPRSPFAKFNKAVSFRIPSATRKSSGHYVKLAGSDLKTPGTTVWTESTEARPDQPPSSDRILIPAELEMAALNVRCNIEHTRDSHPRRQLVSGLDHLKQSSPVKCTSIVHNNSFRSNLGRPEDGPRRTNPISSSLRLLGKLILTASTDSCDVDDDDSDREDVTPFRRPDINRRDRMVGTESAALQSNCVPSQSQSSHVDHRSPPGQKIEKNGPNTLHSNYVVLPEP